MVMYFFGLPSFTVIVKGCSANKSPGNDVADIVTHSVLPLLATSREARLFPSGPDLRSVLRKLLELLQ
jgi:hypothetical protein